MLKVFICILSNMFLCPRPSELFRNVLVLGFPGKKVLFNCDRIVFLLFKVRCGHMKYIGQYVNGGDASLSECAEE